MILMLEREVMDVAQPGLSQGCRELGRRIDHARKRDQSLHLLQGHGKERRRPSRNILFFPPDADEDVGLGNDRFQFGRPTAETAVSLSGLAAMASGIASAY